VVGDLPTPTSTTPGLCACGIFETWLEASSGNSTSCRFCDVNDFVMRVRACVLSHDFARRVSFTVMLSARSAPGSPSNDTHGSSSHPRRLSARFPPPLVIAISPRRICPCWPKLDTWLRAVVPQSCCLTDFAGSAHAASDLVQWFALVAHSFLVSLSSFRNIRRTIDLSLFAIKSRSHVPAGYKYHPVPAGLV
jgi:hypothetical protein